MHRVLRVGAHLLLGQTSGSHTSCVVAKFLLGNYIYYATIKFGIVRLYNLSPILYMEFQIFHCEIV